MSLMYHNAKCLEVLEQLDKLPGIQADEPQAARNAAREAFVRLDRARQAWIQYQACRRNVETLLSLSERTPKNRAKLRKQAFDLDRAQNALTLALAGWL